MEERRCRYCKRAYPLNKTYFGHAPGGTFRWKCRKCMTGYVNEYNSLHSDRARERTEQRKSTSFTTADRLTYWSQIERRDGAMCFYCKTPADSTFHIDHKMPIARGGEHVLENFVLACMPCNQEKHAKTIDEYRNWRRQRGYDVSF